MYTLWLYVYVYDMYIYICIYTTNIYHLGCSNYMYFLLLKSPEIRPVSCWAPRARAFLARCQSDLWTPGPTKPIGWIHLEMFASLCWNLLKSEICREILETSGTASPTACLDPCTTLSAETLDGLPATADDGSNQRGRDLSYNRSWELMILAILYLGVPKIGLPQIIQVIRPF